MKKIRVLVVDDAVVIRRLISDALGNDPDIEVVGTAPNGRVALQRIDQLRPDLVTLDIEMPEMDGLTALTEIRKRYPKLPVIMFSTLTERGGQATLEALARGATDYVTKPANIGGINEGLLRCRDELVPKIKWLTGRQGAQRPEAPHLIRAGAPAAGGSSGAPEAVKPSVKSRVPVIAASRGSGFMAQAADVIAIAISTGGPVALGKLVPLFPPDLRVPIVIVQHMPPVFTRLLAERLATGTSLKVVEGAKGMKVVPGCIYVAPGGMHMIVRREADGSVVLDTHDDAPENSCRPAADVLFRSVVKTYGAKVAAAVLTGMGQDGMRGAEAVRAAGGTVVAQDEATCVVWGMPGAVVNAGLADEVLPLDQIAAALARRTRPGSSISPAPRPSSAVA